MSYTKMETESAKFPSVQEAILKKRRKRAADQAKSVKNNIKARRVAQKKGAQNRFKPPEYFIHRYVVKEKDGLRIQRVGMEKSHISPEEKGSLVFVVRFRAVGGLEPNVRKALELLRLNDANQGVFMCMNVATRRLLRILEPYVTWGRPGLQTVRDLIYKRGQCQIDNRRMPITSNELIESQLGEKHVICLEDLLHEIVTVGPSFEYCCRFLAPFRLNLPAGGWRQPRVAFSQGGDFGDRADKMDELLAKMI